MDVMPELPNEVWVDVRDLTVHFSNEKQDPNLKLHFAAEKQKSLMVSERDEFIRNNYGKLSADTIAKMVGLTKGSVQVAACKLGVTRKKKEGDG